MLSKRRSRYSASTRINLLRFCHPLIPTLVFFSRDINDYLKKLHKRISKTFRQLNSGYRIMHRFCQTLHHIFKRVRTHNWSEVQLICNSNNFWLRDLLKALRLEVTHLSTALASISDMSTLFLDMSSLSTAETLSNLLLLLTSALGVSNLVALGASRLAMGTLVLLVSLFATAVTPDSAM